MNLMSERSQRDIKCGCFAAQPVFDGSLRRELKQLVRRQPTVSRLDARAEAIRWEQEGLPGGVWAEATQFFH